MFSDDGSEREVEIDDVNVEDEKNDPPPIK